MKKNILSGSNLEQTQTFWSQVAPKFNKIKKKNLKGTHDIIGLC